MSCISILLVIILVFLVYLYFCYNKKDSFTEPDHNKSKCTQEMRDKLNMVVIDNFLTPEECDHVIAIAEPKLKRSTVMGDKNDEITDYRTSDNIFMRRNEDPILARISDRVHKMVGIPIENQEALQILRYKEGKYYKQHYDACLDDTENCKRDRKLRGVRINTALIYLSDCEGGETSFNNIGIKIKPKKGTVLFFNPVYKDSNGNYQHNPCSLHAALKPKKGQKKYNLTVWSRDKSQLFI